VRLPDRWRLSTIGEVADTALGKMLDRGKVRGLPEVPYLRNVNVQWGRIDTDDVFSMEMPNDERDRFEVRAGDLLVCEGGEIGRAAIWPGGTRYMAYQKALHRLRPRPNIDTKFLRYLLEHQAGNGTLARHSTGSTIAHLPQQRLREVPVPLPTFEEQRRIVDILEDHLSRLDAAEVGLTAALWRSHALLKSSLWSATHGAGQRVLLTDVAEVRLGRQRSPSNHFGDRMVPYLRAANVDWDHLRLDDIKSMNFTAAEEQAYALREGDIVMTEASGSASEVGKSAIYRDEVAVACFQNTLLRVRCHGANPNFIQKYLLAEAYAGRFVAESRGVGIHHLGRSRLANWTVELPDEHDQESAAAMADEALVFIRRLGTQIDQSVRRGRALRRALLATAFSGKLTGRHTDIEVVAELAGV